MLTTDAHAVMMARLEPLMAEALTRKTGDLPAPIGTERALRQSQMSRVFIGVLPEHLRGLHFLQTELKAAVEAECHRRCIELLGSETYDNEHVEFQVYCQVTDNQQFAGEGIVRQRLCKEIEKAFPVTSGTRQHTYVIDLDANWDLYLVGQTANLSIDEGTAPQFSL